MESRTCSHKVAELYQLIILDAKFSNEFCTKESIYKNNNYYNIFRDKSYKTKLLIVSYSNQEIIYENINDDSFLIYNDLFNDEYLFSINTFDSSITKFNNPILSNGLINNFQKVNHPFISIAKKINDICLKDNYIYFSIIILALKIETETSVEFKYKKEKNYITLLDKVLERFKYEECTALIGLYYSDLLESGRIEYDTNYPIEIVSSRLNRPNSILVLVYDNYFMESIAHFIDFDKKLTKQLHPLRLLLKNDNYIIILPYFDYNSYDDFVLIRLNDLKCFDFYSILPDQIKEEFRVLIEESVVFENGGSFFNSEYIKFITNETLIFGDYEFYCPNLFEGTSINLDLVKVDNTEKSSLILLKSEYFEGYAIELHTIKSNIKSDGTFETLRTHLGELLYRLKYSFDKSVIEQIAIRCAEIIKNNFSNIDVIIPAPPSNLNRPFQPLYELTKRMSELANIPCDLNYIKKHKTEQIKTLTKKEERNLILDRAIFIQDNRYSGKSILLFDDLFRSGDTLNVLSQKLLKEGCVKSVHVLCVTKTRTKR